MLPMVADDPLGTIKTRQHRVAVYDGDGESEFDLVIGEEMDWERAMSIVGQNDEE